MDSNSRQLSPSGDLSIFEAAAFKESLLSLLANDGLVCLDLGAVTRVDSSAIQLIWAARRLGRLLVTKIPQDVDQKMKLLGFNGSLSE